MATGTVKWLNVQKRYGLGGGKDVFAYISPVDGPGLTG